MSNVEQETQTDPTPEVLTYNVKCICGAELTRDKVKRHIATKKHIATVEAIQKVHIDQLRATQQSPKQHEQTLFIQQRTEQHEQSEDAKQTEQLRELAAQASDIQDFINSPEQPEQIKPCKPKRATRAARPKGAKPKPKPDNPEQSEQHEQSEQKKKSTAQKAAATKAANKKIKTDFLKAEAYKVMAKIEAAQKIEIERQQREATRELFKRTTPKPTPAAGASSEPSEPHTPPHNAGSSTSNASPGMDDNAHNELILKLKQNVKKTAARLAI